MTSGIQFHPFNIFPQPRNISAGYGFYCVGSRISIHCCEKEDELPAALLGEHIESLCGIVPPVSFAGSPAPGDISFRRDSLGLKRQGYKLSVSAAGIDITGADSAGTLFAVQTLIQLSRMEDGELRFPCVEIEDWPELPVRGAHVYLPARESMAEFKHILRALAFIKMNMVIIEVGGGMQYERHPEINEAWEKLCRDAHAYPGGPRAIQATEAYWKDSMHTELGGGSFLTKAEVRGIVEYAKGLGLDVIPEVQSLSHSYYLTMAHRDIAEHPQEPWPDSYCPSNPKSYELYFDVAEEVLEVFQPKTASIGHDEVRILGECPLCREKSGEDLLAGDLNRLHAFYKQKNVRMMMWGEMIQRFRAYDGLIYGGVFDEHTDEQGRYWRVPDTYKAVDMVPNDILILDWYHSLGATEPGFEQKGFMELYGNFSGSRFADFDRRSRHGNVIGGEVSTWCLADGYTIARNNVIHDFLYSAGMLWQGGTRNEDWEGMNRAVMGLMPRVREIIEGKKSPLGRNGSASLRFPDANPATGGTSFALRSSECASGSRLPALLNAPGSPETLSAVTLGNEWAEIPVGGKALGLVFLHAAEKQMPYIASIEFADMSGYILGEYEILYEDGSTDTVRLHYGVHIGKLTMDWGRTRRFEEGMPDTVDQRHDNQETGETSEPPYYSIHEPWLGSLLYFTSPVRQGGHTIYAYEWVNPKPEVSVMSVRARKVTADIGQEVYLFGVAAVEL